LAELFVVNGICGGTVFFLPDVPTVVGRSAECHVQIADPWISSMHALFERRGDQLWVVDLDSRNGTFVAEERVHEAPLRPGVKIRFGKTEAEIRSGHDSGESPGLMAGESTIIRYLSDLVGEEDAPAPPAGEGEATVVARRRGPSSVTASGRRQVQVLNEIGRITMSGSSLDETLRQILRALSASVGAERASVLLLDETGEMVPHAVEPPGADPRISATVVKAALRSRAGILTFDAQQDLRFAQSQSVISQGIRSCLAAPIWADNRILGALVLDRSFTDPFNAEDLELATLVGLQAAMAVERSRLAERSRAADEQRQRLLRHLPAATAAQLLASEPERDLLAPAVRPDAASLSVVLCDASDLASARPPAEAAARVLAAQEAAREILLAEGAAVETRMTGEIVAVFGVTPPEGDAAGRAMRCALAVRDRIRALEANRPEPRLAARAGVDAGPVLAGNFAGPDQPELRAVGAPIESACRLAAEAGRNAVLVGAGAAERAGARFELSPATRDGWRELKGAR
jgi:GAF domain-containing protein